MSKIYNNIQDLATGNLYKMLNDDRYQDKDSQTMIKSELNFRNVNDLKAWQDGSLINDDAINRLSLQQLNDLNKLLEGVK
tara:strand:- start:122 stop:361 length:240 start_codon:yes stop_codon:yes gene_type:complete